MRMSNEMSLDQSITAVFYTVLMILILIGLKTGVFSDHKDDIGMVEKGIGFFVIVGWFIAVIVVLK